MTRSEKARTVLLGNVYGKLTVTEFVEMKPKTSIWKAMCECGKETIVQRSNLTSGATTSCGCYQKESVAKRSITHGNSIGGIKTATYKTWESMKGRCNIDNNINSEHYSEKGIQVCDRWLESFDNFLEDMGERPSDLHSIDRENNELGYSKDNCKWATMTEQNRNTSKSKIWTVDGVDYPSYRQAAKELNMCEDTLRKKCIANKDGYSCRLKYEEGVA